MKYSNSQGKRETRGKVFSHDKVLVVRILTFKN